MPDPIRSVLPYDGCSCRDVAARHRSCPSVKGDDRSWVLRSPANVAGAPEVYRDLFMLLYVPQGTELPPVMAAFPTACGVPSRVRRKPFRGSWGETSSNLPPAKRPLLPHLFAWRCIAHCGGLACSAVAIGQCRRGAQSSPRGCVDCGSSARAPAGIPRSLPGIERPILGRFFVAPSHCAGGCPPPQRHQSHRNPA